MQPKLYFNIAEAVDFCKVNFNVDLTPLKVGFKGFEFAPQSVFQLCITPYQFHLLQNELGWFTKNDLTAIAEPLPHIFIQNPRSEATASLVQVLEENASHVKFKHVYGQPEQVFEMSKRQFVLNAQQL